MSTEIIDKTKRLIGWPQTRPALTIVLLSIVTSLVCRILLDSRFGTSSLLYIGVPSLVTFAVVLADYGRASTHWLSKYYRALRGVLIVLGIVSILLYEGFICVLMFLPIYLTVSLIAMIAEALARLAGKRGRGKVPAHALPAVLLLLSLEGTHEAVSFDRYNEVRVTRTVAATPGTLLANIGQPFNLATERAWFLRVFPMPDPITRAALTPGAVHEVRYTYHRWFVMNTHRGRMLLEMTDVDASGVTTTVLEDTSYLSSYLNLLGTRIDLQPIDHATTAVTLTVRFERKLDPAWYFGPLQRYGVAKMAELLINEVVVR